MYIVYAHVHTVSNRPGRQSGVGVGGGGGGSHPHPEFAVDNQGGLSSPDFEKIKKKLITYVIMYRLFL